MGLLDSLKGIFGGKSNGMADALADGKLDMNDVKDQAVSALDSNDDGKLDAGDLDVNRDGQVNVEDIDAAKDKLGVK